MCGMRPLTDPIMVSHYRFQRRHGTPPHTCRWRVITFDSEVGGEPVTTPTLTYWGLGQGYFGAVSTYITGLIVIEVVGREVRYNYIIIWIINCKVARSAAVYIRTKCVFDSCGVQRYC